MKLNNECKLGVEKERFLCVDTKEATVLFLQLFRIPFCAVLSSLSLGSVIE